MSQGFTREQVFFPIVPEEGGSGATSLTGILTGNGTSPFTASPVNQYRVLLGGVSNAVSQVASEGTSGQVLTSNGAGSNPTFEDNSNGTLVASGTLDNSQIKNLNSTPVEIVAAPGVGFTLFPQQIMYRLNYGGNNAFTDGGNLEGRFGNGSLCLNTSDNVYTATTDGTCSYSLSQIIFNEVGNIQNQNLELTTQTSDPGGNASNDNTLTYYLIYQIIQLPSP